jgi:hypothetical protein
MGLSCEVDHVARKSLSMAYMSSFKQFRHLYILLVASAFLFNLGQCGYVVSHANQAALSLFEPGGAQFLYATGLIDPTANCSNAHLVYAELDPLLAPLWTDEITYLLAYKGLTPGDTRSTLLTLGDLAISIEAYKGD